MNRAYSVLTVRSVDAEQRVITGTATTPTTDRIGDVIEPLGVKFKNPMPLLWQHRHAEPVGTVRFDKPTEAGITFEAKFAKIAEPGKLKERIDEAWQSVKAGLVKAVSIGFRDIEHSVMADGGWRFIKTEVYELSLVTIPANAEATIATIKSIDERLLALSGRATGSPRRKAKPAVAARSTSHGDREMDMHEQAAALEERRDELRNDMKSFGDVTDLDDEQAAEFDRVSKEFEETETQLHRVNRMVKALGAAKGVSEPRGRDRAERDRDTNKGGEKKEDLPPGIAFVRVVKAMTLPVVDQRFTGMRPRDVAKVLYGVESSAFQYLSKAAVEGGTATDATWAGPLVPAPSGILGDFVEFLRPKTIIGKFGTGVIPSLRRVPFRTRLVGQTSGGAGYWVGEGKAKPLTKVDFEVTQLTPLKVANIAVTTMELLRDSSPSAEALVRDALAAALIERLDRDFVDPAKAAVAGVSPASIINGVTAVTASGTGTADDIRADIIALMKLFIAANNVPSQGVWIMPTAVALATSMLLNPLGQPEFPTLNINGGTLNGLPVIVSDYVPFVSAGDRVILVNATDIWLGDEGGIDVAVSREASLQMDDAPTMDASSGTGTSVVSMFQTNSVAFLAERTINWAKRRATAAQWLTAVNWAGA